MNNDFLGRGWSFPPTFSQELQGVEMVTREADITSSLEVLLTTALGERIMLPDYGCNMDELIFEALDATTKALIADKIETAILYFESRIELENVFLDDSRGLEGVILIEITYRIRATNSRFNFVFPFYKQEGTDINLATTLDFLPEKN